MFSVEMFWSCFHLWIDLLHLLDILSKLVEGFDKAGRHVLPWPSLTHCFSFVTRVQGVYIRAVQMVYTLYSRREASTASPLILWASANMQQCFEIKANINRRPGYWGLSEFPSQKSDSGCFQVGTANMFYILSQKHDSCCSRCWLMKHVGAQLIDYCPIYNSAQPHEAHRQSSRQANVTLQPKEIFNISSTSFLYLFVGKPAALRWR